MSFLQGIGIACKEDAIQKKSTRNNLHIAIVKYVMSGSYLVASRSGLMNITLMGGV
jgi:hypothetical protein